MNNNARKKELEATSTTPDISPEDARIERRRIYRNVLVISFSFLLLFVAFESMSKLQSSINVVGGLGVWSNAMVYASLILSCMFLPSIMIDKLTVKWALVVSVFCYSSYIISTAVLSSGTDIYVELTDEQMGRCGSNFCSQAPVPDTVTDESLIAPTLGGLVNATEEELDVPNGNFATDISKIYIMAGIYLACSVTAAILIALFVDPLHRFGITDEKKDKEKLTGLQLLVATFRHMVRKEQLLIIPLTFWSGIEQGFFGADFTAGFVTCAYGVHTVGRVLILFGVCDALASIGFGFIIKKVGRMPIFILGACLNALVIIVMLSWTPTQSTLGVVYFLAALWGIGDAIWQTQINALYGCLFANDEEAAFSNYRLWESMGFLFAFITNATGVCVFPKIITTIIFLVLGMVGYFIVEYLERGKSQSVTPI